MSAMPPTPPGRGPIDPGSMTPPPPPPPGMPMYYSPPAPPHRSGRSIIARILTGLLTAVLGVSLLLNLWLGAFFVSAMSMGAQEEVFQKGDTAHRIVILPLKGEVNDRMVREVRESLAALRHDLPAALILRVQSPGGGVGASDRIWHEIKRFKDQTGVKVVASYGEVAASGGYYISCQADYIVAEPTTITGSIGVIMANFSVDGLMQKIGVTPTVLTAQTSPRKEVANNPFRPFEEKDRQFVQPILDDFHQLFLQRVYDGRSKVVAGLTMDDVKQAGLGQAMLTGEAIKAKIVDAEGYLEDAIAKAGALAGVPGNVTPQVTVLVINRGMLASLGMGAQGPSPTAGITGQQVRSLLMDISTPELEYRYLPAR